MGEQGGKNKAGESEQEPQHKPTWINDIFQVDYYQNYLVRTIWLSIALAQIIIKTVWQQSTT